MTFARSELFKSVCNLASGGPCEYAVGNFGRLQLHLVPYAHLPTVRFTCDFHNPFLLL